MNMNYRMKSKKKGSWAFVKFKADVAIYAMCQNCGFLQSGVYENIAPAGQGFKMIPRIDRLYRYCPGCGLKMHPYNGTNIYKIDRYVWQ